jgi:hypothetical protein
MSSLTPPSLYFHRKGPPNRTGNAAETEWTIGEKNVPLQGYEPRIVHTV